MKRAFLLPALLALAACSPKTDEPADSRGEDTTMTSEESGCTPPDIAVGETIEIAPGLEATKLAGGYGRRVTAGDTVEVHYTGWLFDPNAPDSKGTKFDSSVDRGQKFQFPLGAGRVIQGWDKGVECMVIGEKRLLKIAPEMGYGARGAGGVIPPNATLLFEVELFGATAPGE